MWMKRVSIVIEWAWLTTALELLHDRYIQYTDPKLLTKLAKQYQTPYGLKLVICVLYMPSLSFSRHDVKSTQGHSCNPCTIYSTHRLQKPTQFSEY